MAENERLISAIFSRDFLVRAFTMAGFRGVDG